MVATRVCLLVFSLLAAGSINAITADAMLHISAVMPNTGVHPGDPITIIGSGFGTDAPAHVDVRVSGIPARNATWLSDTMIAFVCPDGIGTSTVTVAVSSSISLDVSSTYSNTLPITYQEPVFSPCPFADHILAATSTDGGDELTICGVRLGRDFGSDWTGELVVTVSDSVCEIDWTKSTPDTAIVCSIPAGVGANIRPLINWNGLSYYPDVRVNYPVPVVLKVSTTNDTVGTLDFDVLGYNFGPKIALASIYVKVGPYTCRNVVWWSDRHVSCEVPLAGVHGANLAVVVTSAGQSSNMLSSAVYDFADPTSSQLGCVPPFGAADQFNSSMCNCFSGYAPSSDNGTDCGVQTQCQGFISGYGHLPAAPITSFSDEVLTITQTAEIVQARRDTHIKIVGQDDRSADQTCNYPGPMWTKTLSLTSCLDVYTFTMPWSLHDLCAFEEIPAPSPATQVYTARALTTVRDLVKPADGSVMAVPYYSISTVSNYITITFQRDLTIVIGDASATPLQQGDIKIDVFVAEEVMFDQAYAYLTFDTIVSAPYKLMTLGAQYEIPEGSSNSGESPAFDESPVMAVTLVNPQPAGLMCGGSADTCTQRWNIQVQKALPSSSGRVCDLKGTFSLSAGVLSCREDDGSAFMCSQDTTTSGSILVTYADDVSICAPDEALVLRDDVADVLTNARKSIALGVPRKDTIAALSGQKLESVNVLNSLFASSATTPLPTSYTTLLLCVLLPLATILSI